MSFAFSALFSAAVVASSLDADIYRNAGAGRVSYTLARALCLEYGLPTLTAQGNAIGKPAALALARGHIATKGEGLRRFKLDEAGQRKPGKPGKDGKPGPDESKKATLSERRAIGAALDALTLALALGKDYTPETVAKTIARLMAEGSYIGGADAWAAYIPDPVKPEATKPEATEATKPEATAPKASEPAGKGKGAADAAAKAPGAPVDYAAALRVVLSGLSAGIYADADVAALRAALPAALPAEVAAPAAEVAAPAAEVAAPAAEVAALPI